MSELTKLREKAFEDYKKAKAMMTVAQEQLRLLDRLISLNSHVPIKKSKRKGKGGGAKRGPKNITAEMRENYSRAARARWAKWRKEGGRGRKMKLVKGAKGAAA